MRIFTISVIKETKKNNSNTYIRLSEDIDIKNVEYEEELVKQRREETENKCVHEADHKKVIERHNIKETGAKKEDSDNKVLNEGIRDNNIKDIECKKVNVVEQSNNKVDIVEKELIKSKRLMEDLRMDVERVCLEYEKLQNKCICREVRCEVLVEKLKDDLCRSMLIHQEEECLEVDDIWRKYTTNANWTQKRKCMKNNMTMNTIQSRNQKMIDICYA